MNQKRLLHVNTSYPQMTGWRLKRAPILSSAELVHDLRRVFTKHWAMIIKGRVGGRGPWKEAPAWIKTVGVSGGWGGPVTSDLHPPGPFRAAQWLTPVSFQCWHYYYLHQSVGETERGQRCCEAGRTILMPTTPPSLFTGALHYSPFTPPSRLPASSFLIVSDKSKHLGGRRGSTSRCVYILWLMICSSGHVGFGVKQRYARVRPLSSLVTTRRCNKEHF